MAGTQGTVSINFQANTAQAQSQIQALANSLNKLMSTTSKSTGFDGLDKQLSNAAKSAATLQVQLQNAVNVKTGNLDLTRFNDSLKASGMTLEQYKTQFAALGSAGDQAFVQLARSIATAEIPLRRSSKLLDDFAVSLKNTVKWQISSSLMHGFIGSINSAMGYAKSLDASLNNIRIITGQSADEMARFAEQANRSAQQLSTTTSEYAKAALIFYQQGLDANDVKERTDAVIKMANVTKDSAEDVSSYMTAIWNNFDDGSTSLEHFADVIVNLGAKTASSSSEIANGLQQFAAVGDMIGLSYEYAASALATIVAQTRQSEETVGNSLKTIFARLQGLQLGETLEDGTDLNKYSAALAKVGVSIKDASGELRSMDDILDDLGSRWQTFSKDTQMALAQTVAGVRQYNNLVALMDNYDFFKRNVKIADMSDGTLQQQADIYAQSWEAARDRVKASLESIYGSLIDDQFFIGFNQTLADILNGIKQFIDGIGGVKGVIASLGTIILTVFNDQISAGMRNFTNNIKMMTKSGQDEIKQLQLTAQQLVISKANAQSGAGKNTITSAYKAEAQAQIDLINNSKKLSDIEQQVAQSLVQQVQLRAQAAVDAGNNLNNTEKQLDSTKKILEMQDQLVSEQIGTGVVGDSLKLIEDQYANFTQISDMASSSISALNAEGADTSVVIQDIINKFSDENLGQGWTVEQTAALEKLRTDLAGAGGDVEKVKAALDTFGESAQYSFKAIESEVSEFDGLIEQFTSDKDIDSGFRALLERTSATFHKAVQEIYAYRDAIRGAKQAENDMGQATKTFSDFLKEAGVQVVSAQDTIMSLGRTITSLTSIINTIGGIQDTLNDKNKTTSEKITAVTGAVGNLLVQLTFLSKNLETLGSGILSVGASLADKAVQSGGMFATVLSKIGVTSGAAMTGVKGFGVSLLAIGHAALPVIAVIGAVAGAFYLIKKAIENYENSKPENIIKRTTDAFEEADKKIKNIVDETTNIYDAIAENDAAVEALDELRSGTDEWDGAVQRVKASYEELSQLPIYQQLVANPEAFGLGSGDIYSYTPGVGYNFSKAANEAVVSATRRTAALGVASGRNEKETALQEQYGQLGLFTPEADNNKVQVFNGQFGDGTPTTQYVFTRDPNNGTSGIYDSQGNFAYGDSTAYLGIGKMLQDPVMGMLIGAYYNNNGDWGSAVSSTSQLMGISTSEVMSNAGYYIVGQEASDSVLQELGINPIVFANFAEQNGYDIGTTGQEEAARVEREYGGVNNSPYHIYNPILEDYMLNPHPAFNEWQLGYGALFGAQAENFSNASSNSIIAGMNGLLPEELATDIATQIFTNIDNAAIDDIIGLSGEGADSVIKNWVASTGKTGKWTGSGDSLKFVETAINEETGKTEEVATYGVDDLREAARGDYIAQQIITTDSDATRRYIESGNSDNVTYAEADEINAELANMGTTFQLEKPTVPKALMPYNTEGELTFGNVNAFQSLGTDTQNYLTSIATSSDQIQGLIESIDGKSGYEALHALDAEAASLGLTIDKTTTQYKALEAEWLNGVPKIDEFEGFAETLALAAQAKETLASGGTIDEETVAALEASGYDMSQLKFMGLNSQGKRTYSGDFNETAPLDAIREAKEVSELYSIDDEGNISYTGSSGRERAASAARVRDYFHLEPGQNLKDVEGGIENARRIDNYKVPEDVAAYISSQGFAIADLLGDATSLYAEEILNAQSQLSEITLTEEEKAAWLERLSDGEISAEDTKEWDKLVSGKNFQTGISDLIGAYTTKDSVEELFKANAAVAGGYATTSQASQVDQAKSSIAKITGKDVSEVNLEEYSGFFDALVSGDVNSLQESLVGVLKERYGDTMSDAEIAQLASDWVNNLISEAEVKISQAVTNSLTNATQENSYDDLSIKQLNEEGVNLRKARTSSKDEQMAYLEAMGYFSNGEITEAGEKIRDEMALGANATASDIYNAIIDGGEEGIAEARQALSLDKDGLLAKSVSEDVRDSYLTTMGRYGKDRDMSRASSVRDVYQNARQYGQDAIDAIDEAFAKAKTPEQLDAITSVLSNLDADATADEISQAFASVGIDAEALGIDCEDLASAMQSAAEATNILTDAVSQYSGLTSAADKLRNEENLTQDEFNTAALAMGNGDMAKGQIMMASYTTLNPDGTYSANEGMGGAIADQLDSYAVNSMVDAANKMADISQAFYDQQVNTEAINNGNGANLDPNVVAATEQTILDYIATNGDRLGLTTEQQSEIQEYRDAGDYEGFRNMEDYDAIYGKANVLAISDTNELQSTSQATEDKIAEDNFDEKVKGFDLDPDEIDDISEAIQGMAESSDELANSLQDDEKEAKEIAKDLGRYDKAIESVTKNYDDWNDALESGNIVDVTKATKEMDEAYSDMLDLDYGVLSDQFLQNKDNLDLMKEAANGSEEAYNQLQQAAQADILMQCEATMDKSAFDAAAAEVQSQMDAMNFQELEIGASLDDADFLSALTDMVNAAGMTADQATSYLSSMGIDAEVIENPVITDEVVATSLTATTGVKTQSYTVPAAEPGGSPQTETASFPTVTYSTEPVTAQKETGAVSLQVTSANKSSGGGFKHSQAGGGGGRRGGGGGRRGGGGGGSRAPRGEKKKEADKERYRPVKNQLEDLTDIYDKVDKAASRAFGKDKVKLLKEQADATKDLIDKQKEYIKEIEEYYQKDKDALKQVQSFSGITFEFDENGTIKNFDEFQDKMFAMYNSHINDKGEVTDMDEEAWSNYEKEWEEMMALVDQYDETQDLLKEQKQQLVDYQNDLYDLILETVTYQVEIRLEVDQNSLDTIDFMLKQIGDSAWDAAESIETLGSKMTDLLDENDMYKNGLRDILGNHIDQNQYDHEGNLITDENGNALTLSKEDVLAAMNNDPAALAKVDELGRKGAFTEEEVQAMRDYSAGLLDVGERLMDLREEMYDKILSAFQDMNAEMEESIDRMGNLIDISKKYKDIVGLVGQTALNISDQFMEAIDQRIGDSMISQLQSSTRQVQMLQNQLMEAQAAQQHAMDEGQEYEVERWGEIIKEIQSKLDDAQLENLEHLEETLQHFLDAYEESVEKAVARASDKMAGPFAKNLDELRKQMDRADQVAERYLPDYEKIYELSKLNRDIQNSIDDTQNVKAKQELAKLQEHINELQESGKEVSEYEVEALRKQYELKLAGLALDEAQDAKSEVRMSRNADGDWSYVYTADEEDVAQAEQTYEDKLFEYQQLNAEYMNNLKDMLIEMEQEYLDAYQELMTRQDLSDEERAQRLEALQAHYQEQFAYYNSELELVFANNQDLYNNDWQTYSDRTGYKISAEEDYVDNFLELSEQTGMGFKTQEEFQQAFNDAIGAPGEGGMLGDVDAAYTAYEENLENTMQAAGMDVDSFKETMASEVADIENEVDNLEASNNDLADNAEENFSRMTDAVQNWSDMYSSVIASILEQNTALKQSFDALMKSWTEYEDGVVGENEQLPGDEPEDPIVDEAKIPSPKPQISKKAVHAAVAIQFWEGGRGNWGTGGTRRGHCADKGVDYNLAQSYCNSMSAVKSPKHVRDLKSYATRKWGIDWTGINLNDFRYDKIDLSKYQLFDTGGYTGVWGDNSGKLAVLHQKEIVLNADDTKNFLSAIDLLRSVSNTIDLNAYASAGYGSNAGAPGVGGASQMLEQNVHIEANFPNVTDRNEIEAAFGDIINLASQYANRG